MEKLNVEIANKLFEGVAKKYDIPEKIKYKVGEENFVIDIYTVINPIDKISLIEAGYIAATMDNEGNEFHRDCIIASTIIEYFTNIPVPKVNEDTNSANDLITCYEIVFGKDGLMDSSDNLCNLVRDVQAAIDNKLAEKKVNYIDKLAEKILEVWDLSKLAITDIIENPVSQEKIFNVIEGMKKSDE